MCWFWPTWHRSSDLVVVDNRNLMNSLRVRGEWSSGGWEDWPRQTRVEVKSLALNIHTSFHRLCVLHAPTFMRVSSCSASCSMPKKRASSNTPVEERRKISKHGTNEGTCCRHVYTCVWYTQRVDAFIDDELPMSQIIQNGFKVVWTAIYQVRSLRVLLVPPHICNSSHNIYVTTHWLKIQRSDSSCLLSDSTFLSEHVSQHALRFFADQCTPEEKHTHIYWRSTMRKASVTLLCNVVQRVKCRMLAFTLWWWSSAHPHSVSANQCVSDPVRGRWCLPGDLNTEVRLL